MAFRPRLVLSAVLDVYILAIIVYVVFSWLPPEHRRYRIYAFLELICEPVLRPIRKLLPSMGGFDLSPLVAIILLRLIGSALLRYVPG